MEEPLFKVGQRFKENWYLSDFIEIIAVTPKQVDEEYKYFVEEHMKNGRIKYEIFSECWLENECVLL